jgi:amidophosphoribosyltransferase
MSDAIKHECGIALIRLRKPLQYYIDKYKTPLYAQSKLYLLMEKQHNRGQDGAGVATVKINQKPGYAYIDRQRSIEKDAIFQIFKKINDKFSILKEENPEKYLDAEYLKLNTPYAGELLLGHLRYGTHGKNDITLCHPRIRQNNWRSRNLVVAGNFNMTNVEELHQVLIELGQHPREKSDTFTVLEKIGHFLDVEVQKLFQYYKEEDYSNTEISDLIESNVNIQNILKRSNKDFDGGYAMAGLIGSGSAFVARDPAGIRPAYYYADDEIVVAASEKPAIKTAFGIEFDAIKELKPGHALIINKKGEYSEEQFIEATEKKSCSFERIYFSRGSDPDIYNERKALGENVVPHILKTIDFDIENTVFSYIPNTAEVAFLGMMKGLEKYLVNYRKKIISEGNLKGKQLEKILGFTTRVEKLVIKDVKARTFITDDSHREEMVAHVYDTTYEVINKGEDNIVVIDDSIVRGTTLEKSILRMLNRLDPKKIVIVSSAPQIRYPDCYGIDMSVMKEFVAFRAAIELHKEHKTEHIIKETYDKCVKAYKNGTQNEGNFVKAIYAPFKYEQISQKIAEIIRPEKLKCDLDVVFQTVEGLQKSCPNHKGDWYFTGDYPTPGGYGVVNKAFINYFEGRKGRAY